MYSYIPKHLEINMKILYNKDARVKEMRKSQEKQSCQQGIAQGIMVKNINTMEI